MKFLIHYYDGNDNRTEVIDAESAADAVQTVETEDENNSVALVVYLGSGSLFFNCLAGKCGNVPVVATERAAYDASEKHFSFQEFIDEMQEVPDHAGR